MNAILDPWPWYLSGAGFALVMLLLLLLSKNFGISANLRTICTICGAGNKNDFFKFDWKTQRWNLTVVLGAVIGGFLAATFGTNNEAVPIHPDVINQLNTFGFEDAGQAYLPAMLFETTVFTDIKSLAILAIGGLLVGFGARYAGGCTSGHAISGLSELQLPSLIAVIGFFAGGLIMVHFLFPLIF